MTKAHGILVQLRRPATDTAFEPLSVVIRTKFSSDKHQLFKILVNSSAIFWPVMHSQPGVTVVWIHQGTGRTMTFRASSRDTTHLVYNFKNSFGQTS